jgi:AraC family transcriptional regulator, melibiose operon regulatory protein
MMSGKVTLPQRRVPQTLHQKRRGIALFNGHVPWMEHYHTHDDLEIDLITGGDLKLAIGGHLFTLPEGRVGVFWAAFPHRVVFAATGAEVHSLTVSLSDFLTWSVGQTAVQQLFGGKLLIDRQVRSQDAGFFSQWTADLESRDPLRIGLVLREARCRVERLVLNARLGAAAEPGVAPSTAPTAERLASYIAGHFLEDMRIRDVARAAGVHPRYAARLFRRFFGVGLLKHLHDYRVAHAQRLLATTDNKVVDIGMSSGFRSTSSFYEVFGRVCKCSPSAYRLKAASALSARQTSRD